MWDNTNEIAVATHRIKLEAISKLLDETYVQQLVQDDARGGSASADAGGERGTKPRVDAPCVQSQRGSSAPTSTASSSSGASELEGVSDTPAVAGAAATM